MSRCATCNDVGWLCSGTTTPADFERGTCCHPEESEEFSLGPGCPSADGCPDCDLAAEVETIREDIMKTALNPETWRCGG